jgi:hypothetical protein
MLSSSKRCKNNVPCFASDASPRLTKLPTMNRLSLMILIAGQALLVSATDKTAGAWKPVAAVLGGARLQRRG